MKLISSAPSNSSYFSAIDFSHHDTGQYEQRCLEEFFFRRCACLEESYFFAKSPFLANLLLGNSIEMQWLKAGLLLPIVKNKSADSFSCIVDTLGPYVSHLGSPSDFKRIADHIDESIFNSSNTKYVTLSANQVLVFDENLVSLFMSEEPLSTQGRFDLMLQRDRIQLEDRWAATTQLRHDWLSRAFELAKSEGKIGVSKADLFRIACMHHGVEPTFQLSVLKERLVGVPDGEQTLDLMRWSHDIFYASRGQAMSIETSFPCGPNEFPIGPYLKSGGFSVGETSIIATEVRLPTMEALRRADSNQLLDVRLNQGESFLNLLSHWSADPKSVDSTEVELRLNQYAEALIKATENSMPSSLTENLFRMVSGPSRSAFAATYGFLNAGAVLAIPQIAPAVAVGSTVLAAPVAGYMIIRALRLSGKRKRIQLRSSLGVRFDP